MLTNWKLMIKKLIIFLCFLSVQMYAPCSLLAVVGDNMSLSADPTTIPADSHTTTTITAVVDKNGVIWPGAQLRFITDRGLFQANGTNTVDVTSDVSGSATAVLRSAIAGTATITCEVVGSVPLLIRTVTVVFFDGQPLGDNMSLSADPTSIQADGLSSTTITAVVNNNGTPLEGVRLTFTTNRGFFQDPTTGTHTNNTIVTYSENGSTQFPPGTSEVVLYSDTNPGTATVTCVASNGTTTFGPVTRTVFVFFTGPAPAGSTVLSANPTSVPADNIQSSTITARLYDQYGVQIVKPGIPVDFNIISGVGHFSNGSTTTIRVATDATGTAAALLSSATVGPVGIGASPSTGVTPPSVTIFVNFTASTPTPVITSIALTSAPSSVPADNLTHSTVTARLFDQDGNQIVKPGIPVVFATPAGLAHFSNNQITITASTAADGTATAFLYSAVPGSASISASSNSITSNNAFVTFTGGAIPSTIVLTASPTSVTADNLTPSTITAKLYDQYGVQIAKPGILVVFSTPAGLAHFSNNSTTITVSTDASGSAAALLYSAVAGSAGVSASTNGVTSSSVFVNFTTPPQPSPTPQPTPLPYLATIVLSATPPAVPADNLTPSSVSAQLYDQNGALLAIPGVSVVFTTTPSGVARFSNNLTTITVSTNGSGTATALLYSPVVGTAAVYATTGFLSANPVFVNFTGPGQAASIVLSANPTSIPSDNTSFSTITATLYDGNGKAVGSGEPITFTTNLGKFTNNLVTITANTDALGVATAVVYSAGSVGTAQISATTANGVASNVFVNFTGPGQAASIVLSANPTSIPSDNTSFSTITATIYDGNGKAVGSGVPLTFTTNLGKFTNNLVTIIANTNTLGVATAVVYSAGTVGTAQISATTANGVSSNVFVNYTGPGQAASIVLSANPTSIPSDNTSFSTITATIYDGNGKAVSSGVPLTFTTNLGKFTNNLVTIIANTNTLGVATAVVYSAGTVGTAQISAATANGVASNVFVNFTGPGKAASIVLSASPTSIPADSTSFSTITAALYDGNGKAVGSGVPVIFTTSIGYFANLQKTITVNTTAAGIASVYVYSGATVGTAQISATTADGVAGNVFVNFTGSGPTAGIVLSADPATIPADSLSFITITATLYDMNGQTVISGVAVNFTTTIGYFTNKLKSITLYTNSKGVASVIIYSGGTIGTAQVSASSNGITRYIDVGFTGSGPTADIVLSANPVTIPSDKTSYSTITATVYDKNGQKVTSGVSVDFSTTLGFFSNTQKTVSAFTNANGIATAYIYSGSFVGLAQVGASSNGVTRYVYVNFSGPGSAAFVSLESSHLWVPADGNSRITISAGIADSVGNPVSAGTIVSFMTTLGQFSNGKNTLTTTTPDATGIVKISLTAGRIAGTATVICNSGVATQSISIVMVKLEYETEPNNDKEHADGICFNTVFLSQLYSPYEEDWYTFTISEPSRISLNFITTAIPKIAGDCKTSTTVGTYRVDLRDVDNNILMSYQNVDCSLDNGIWETGVVTPGTYYVVVFCPRLPDNSHFLSSPYYLAVFNSFYFPCGNSDKLVNSASLSLETSAYHLYVPIIDTTPNLWVDFQYDPNQTTRPMFRLTDIGVLTNLNDFRSCNQSTLSLVDGKYILHIPALAFDGVSFRVDLTYVPSTDGLIWFTLSGVWLN